MHVLVLGEGENDLGNLAENGSLTEKGPVPILVERLVNVATTNVKLSFRAEYWRRIRTFPAKSHRTRRARGFDAKLRAVLALDRFRTAEAIVGVCDRDGERNQSRIDQLHTGKESVEQQGKRCAVGVAIETIEAWLLADEKSLRQALGDGSIQRHPDPESLTSRREESNRNPKGLLRRLVDNAPVQEEKAWVVHYAAIARSADTGTIESRCPRGFAPFAAQVRGMVQR